MVKYDRNKISTQACPKCGADMGLHKLYHTPAYKANNPEHAELNCEEHLEVSCGTCSYSQQYLPLDSKEVPQDGV